MIIVIDTNIVVKGFVDEDLLALDYFLGHFRNRCRHIAIDFDGRMMKEYRDNTRGNKLFEKWLVHLQQNNQVQYFDGTLPERVRKQLLELKFHEEADHVFVAVAMNAGRILLTEDSDYGKGDETKAAEKKAVLDYLLKELNLQVFDMNEIMEYLSNAEER